MTQKNRIKELFGQLEELPYNLVVCLPSGKPTLDTEYVTLDPEALLATHSMENRLSVEDILDIRDYQRRHQGKTPTESELLDACTFYLENEHLPES